MFPGFAGVLLIWTGCLFDTGHTPPAILFVGNSITAHLPLPEVGWMQKNGMAATDPDSDYVHRTLRYLEAKGVPARAEYGLRDCDGCSGVFEEHRGNFEAIMDRIRPRWAVVQLGENLIDFRADAPTTLEFRALLLELRKGGTFPIFCITAWGNASLEDPQNRTLQSAMRGIPKVHLVDITSAAADPANYGDSSVYWNAAVQWHPGNRGMDAIAAILADSLAAHP